jgi:hypothetical protein
MSLVHILCRSPYDIARDKKLWAAGAYDNLEQALHSVNIPVHDWRPAVDALKNKEEKSEAIRYWERQVELEKQEQQKEEQQKQKQQQQKQLQQKRSQKKSRS